MEDERADVKEMLALGMGDIRLRVWEVELVCGNLRLKSGETGTSLGQPLFGYVSCLEVGQYNRTAKLPTHFGRAHVMRRNIGMSMIRICSNTRSNPAICLVCV